MKEIRKQNLVKERDLPTVWSEPEREKSRFSFLSLPYKHTEMMEEELGYAHKVTCLRCAVRAV